MNAGSALTNVSRETEERLRAFADLVLKWTPKINLISKKSQDDIWERHIVDSIQVARCSDASGHWVDLGSGGGFPGVVVAIMAKEQRPETRFTLIESDQRKSAFLRTAIRTLDLNACVLTDRIETVPAQRADILSARALTDLNRLLAYAERHLTPGGAALFQKGANWEKEVEEARKYWNFNCEPIRSQTQEAAAILKIEGVSRD
ncbi:16S rRNA (guanine(527)-N(7))-methyltransferase RsmG [Aestuariivita sp.]|jgi:16S rRNA (guanine527-N7)-methyltransferase|uniref:16S rRNA (guanine(527)-N(7))-methyltransferase RsmG n=1 Tax=Aestuariivita sp. TaxID=1872407 RepID=UPI00216BA5D5|nr:16S rRNA (guanine(527)-N(7))-methyltransferase RsmG [Aestuariivita sp.]MCE8005512.1 16S rRNA (guanine(527)-N(7))-methyltransferase RsmG [Aestuariivita sp.]